MIGSKILVGGILADPGWGNGARPRSRPRYDSGRPKMVEVGQGAMNFNNKEESVSETQNLRRRIIFGRKTRGQHPEAFV